MSRSFSGVCLLVGCLTSLSWNNNEYFVLNYKEWLSKDLLVQMISHDSWFWPKTNCQNLQLREDTPLYRGPHLCPPSGFLPKSLWESLQRKGYQGFSLFFSPIIKLPGSNISNLRSEHLFAAIPLATFNIKPFTPVQSHFFETPLADPQGMDPPCSGLIDIGGISWEKPGLRSSPKSRGFYRLALQKGTVLCERTPIVSRSYFGHWKDCAAGS